MIIKKILFFTLLLSCYYGDSAQFDNNPKTLPAPFINKVEKEKVLYLIDSAYFDNDSTTAFPSPPDAVFTQTSIRCQTAHYVCEKFNDAPNRRVGAEV